MYDALYFGSARVLDTITVILGQTETITRTFKFELAKLKIEDWRTKRVRGTTSMCNPGPHFTRG